jgi:hypothetical protein
MLLLVLAAQHRCQRLAKAIDRDVGDEAQAALVDADERYVEARQLACDAQHRAVAADHDSHVALAPEVIGLDGVIARQAGGQGGGPFERHVQPLAGEELGHLVEQFAHALGLRLAHDGSVTEALRGTRRGHAADHRAWPRACAAL